MKRRNTKGSGIFTTFRQPRPKLWRALRAHLVHHTHVLTALVTDKNLARIAQRKEKAEAGRRVPPRFAEVKHG